MRVATIPEYDEFMTLHSLPLPARYFNSVIKSLSPSYVHLFKTYLCFNERKTITPKLLLDGVCFLDKKQIKQNNKQTNRAIVILFSIYIP